jgi:hypothetical protein
MVQVVKYLLTKSRTMSSNSSVKKINIYIPKGGNRKERKHRSQVSPEPNNVNTISQSARIIFGSMFYSLDSLGLSLCLQGSWQLWPYGLAGGGPGGMG